MCFICESLLYCDQHLRENCHSVYQVYRHVEISSWLKCQHAFAHLAAMAVGIFERVDWVSYWFIFRDTEKMPMLHAKVCSIDATFSFGLFAVY